MSTIITPDYYETLELTRTNATQESIKEAYRNLSMRFHPSKASSSLQPVYEHKFHKIAEAYTVLSDPNKKGIYDIYGKDGLYNGIRDPTTNELKGAYKYTGNAYDIFNTFMETTNPYTIIRDNDRMDDAYGTLFSSANGGMAAPKVQPLKPIEVEFKCTLEELYNGTIRDLEYEAEVLSLNKRTSDKVVKKVQIEVFPGYDEKTVLTFKGQGNEAPGMDSSDLIVKIKQIEHEKFRRVNGNDLVYTCNLKLSEALNSVPVEIDMLDGRKLRIANDEIVNPSTVKVVKGEGMPVFDNENKLEGYISDKKGDLYIRFNIVFPEYINGKKKDKITELLTE